ncbi:MAG TPA: sigma factor [Polyangiaceae bacterium]|nr:sigma factor [Polyangiaceae bacterium]
MGAESESGGRPELDDQVRLLLETKGVNAAATHALRALGPEILGFIVGVVRNRDDANEIFSATSERLWRSLPCFQQRCSLRTWTYVIARHEIARFYDSERRHCAGRVPISEIEDVVAALTTQTRQTQPLTELRDKFTKLRDDLPVDDRMLLVLRVDRQLPWDAIALAFADAPEACGDDERKREAARLRKRFQIVRDRLMARVRAEGLVT